MAITSLRSTVSIPLRRRTADPKPPIRISPPRKPTQIKSTLTLTSKSPIFSHKIDDWVHESAAEIVRNLRRAPLLVQVHDDGGGERRLETEEAAEEGWETVARRWRDGEAPVPDGVMLVEPIRVEGEDEEERETRAWGILVQGRGCDFGPRCYLLKTCRVGSGVGFGCTHFCLTRVSDFREGAFSQLNSCWLLN